MHHPRQTVMFVRLGLIAVLAVSAAIDAAFVLRAL